MSTPNHPLIRLALPSLTLWLFHWVLFVHPTRSPETTAAKLTAEESRRLLEQSRELLHAHRYKEALNVVLQLHDADPRNHVYLFDLATIFGNLGRPDEEVRYWEMFFDRAPLPIEACPQIGLAYQKQSRIDEAVHALERCLTLDSTNSDSLFFLAHALERKGDFTRAADLYKRGLTIAPNYLDLRIGLARVELHQGHPKEAREMSLQVLQRSADNADALLVAGLASWRSGDRAAARAHLERGARLAPNDPDFQTALKDLAREERQ
jgi:tetratricopeptide (TPR) repeat protein